MELVPYLRLEGEDNHIANRLQLLGSLTRIDARAEDDPERRAFRRIRGGVAPVEDFTIALRAALAEADRIALRADTEPCPFPEIPGRSGSVEADWRYGLTQVPGLIRREVETIQGLIQEGCGVDLLTQA